ILSFCGGFLSFLRLWVWFHTLLAVSFMALLAYRWYNDPWAAAVAGLLYGFNGFLIARVTLPNHFAAIAWLPVMLFFLDKKSTLGFAASLAMQWLCGEPSYTYLSVLFCGLWASQECARRRCFLAGGALGAGLSAAQWLPFLEMLRLSV